MCAAAVAAPGGIRVLRGGGAAREHGHEADRDERWCCTCVAHTDSPKRFRGHRRPVYRKRRPVWPLSNGGGRPYTLARPDDAWRRAAMAKKQTTTKQAEKKTADPTAEMRTKTTLL